MIRLKENVEQFMDEFVRKHVRFEQLIDQGRFEDVNPELLEMMERTLPGFAFRLFRPQNSRQIHLELTTTLDPARRILAYYFCSRLPDSLKSRWCFDASHPALKGSFTHNGRTWRLEEIQVIPMFDNKRHRLNLKVEKHPKFKGLREEDCFMILYMMLSDTLGEIAVDAYLGSLQFIDGVGRLTQHGKKRVSLLELEDVLHKECEKRGWIDPQDIVFIAENYTRRTRKLQLRQDIVEGISFCLPLLNEEGEAAEKQISTHLIRACQAGYCSVAVNVAPTLPKKEKIAQREIVEKEVNRILSEDQSGMLINAALGNAHGYVDFLVFDPAALDAVKAWTAGTSQLEVLELN